MANIKACMSHNTDHWSTPSELYKYFMDQGFIDPCPLHCESNCFEKVYIEKKLFVNPPFSQLDKFVDWCLDQYLLGHCKVVILMPSRTDTKYFHKLLEYNPYLYFFKGRLHFNDSKQGAPFPTMLIGLNTGRSLKVWFDFQHLVDYL